MSGGVINTRIVMAAAEGIVMKLNKKHLIQFGGHIDITPGYAQSLLRRMDFVKRKGTKGTKTLPKDYECIKKAYVDRYTAAVTEHSIPDELVINIDQTGCSLVPGGGWTLEQSGVKQVTVIGLEDKRQITALLAITKAGDTLPPQLIYTGKTDRSLPKHVIFPAGWDITCNASHWSTEETMLRYVDTVLKPYIQYVRNRLEKPDQKALLILDVFAAHRVATVMRKVEDAGFVLLYVPAACTDKLQPLDLLINKPFKEALKGAFHKWYSNEVVSQMSAMEDEGGEANMSAVRVDLRLSVIKPMHAQWLIEAHKAISQKGALIKESFVKAGLIMP